MAEQRFGDEIRRLRRQANLNLADLADEDVLDCSITFVSDVERGKKNPPVGDKLRKLLKRLGSEDRFNEFELMAIKARQSIEISMKNKGAEEMDLLVALARRCDEGGIDPVTAKKLRELLEENGKQ